ncbi:uncharacterized protein LOC121854091 [Homarus americanus]|uniref:uncharacterized protein LOC121854091 n=1 Tax=Homarus americanus TaxID=6706 RepID=UPI001C45CA39|nr:uncharacterized protein LOC121854091 [Homarus americanus]
MLASAFIHALLLPSCPCSLPLFKFVVLYNYVYLAAVNYFSSNLSGAEPGENFSSELAKIRVEAQVLSGSRVTTHYSLVAKFLLGNEFRQESYKHGKAHLRELLIYSDVIPEINDFQSKIAEDKYRIHIPKFIYGKCTKDEYVLVMEDLSPAGYVNEDKRQGLDLHHLLYAVHRLATLHAVSYAYGKTHNFMEKYPSFVLDKNFYAPLASFISVIYDGGMKLVEQKQNEELFKKMKMNKTSLINSYISSYRKYDAQDIVCLVHGDFWTNNMMFKHKESECGGEAAIEGFQFIDWGNVQWHNPVYDLQYVVHSSTTFTLRQDHLEEILQHYYSTFNVVTAKMDVSVVNWSYEDFKNEWRRTLLSGTLLGMMVTMITQSEIGKTYQDTSTLSSGVAAKIKTGIARVIMPIFMQPSFQFFTRRGLSMAFGKFFQEMLSDTNELMTSRVYELFTNANDSGVFDA